MGITGLFDHFLGVTGKLYVKVHQEPIICNRFEFRDYFHIGKTRG